MKVLFLGTPQIFYIIPRVHPIITDTLVLTLRNEITDTIITPAITFVIGEKLEIIITTQPTDFKTQNKYEVSLHNETELIYKGKIIILEEGTDIQNYEYNTQSNARFDYK